MIVPLQNPAVQDILNLSFESSQNLERLQDGDPLTEKKFFVQQSSLDPNDDSPKNIIDILQKFYKENPLGQSASIKMTGPDRTKFLQLSTSNMILDQEEYRVATFRDETESKTLAKVE